MRNEDVPVDDQVALTEKVLAFANDEAEKLGLAKGPSARALAGAALITAAGENHGHAFVECGERSVDLEKIAQSGQNAAEHFAAAMATAIVVRLSGKTNAG